VGASSTIVAIGGYGVEVENMVERAHCICVELTALLDLIFLTKD
jgi:hypothetical protein